MLKHNGVELPASVKDVPVLSDKPNRLNLTCTFIKRFMNVSGEAALEINLYWFNQILFPRGVASVTYELNPNRLNLHVI